MEARYFISVEVAAHRHCLAGHREDPRDFEHIGSGLKVQGFF